MMRSILVAALVVSGPAAADPQRVSFDDALALAFAHNADARLADDQIRRSRALLREASSVLLPLVTAGAGVTRLEGDRSVLGRETSAADSFGAAVTASLPLVDLRAGANRSRAADQLDVATADAASVRRAVAIETGHAYLAVLAAQQLITVARQARDTAQAHVDFAAQRHSGGVGTDLDTVRARSELAADDSQLAAITTGQLRAQEALGVITGQPTALAIAEPPDLAAPVDDRARPRADVIAYHRRVETAQRSLDAQWTEYAPVLGLSGQAFYGAPTLAPTPALGYQVVVSLSIPLYDGGYRAGLREQREADVLAARESLLQAERVASSEIRVARAAVDDAAHAASAAHQAAELATRALELATVAYHGGAATNLEVIDAERSARDAATRAVIADDELRQVELDLRAATGMFP